MKREELQKLIAESLSHGSVKKLEQDLKKALYGNAKLAVKKNKIVVEPRYGVNDIVEFRKGLRIEKAVITAVGRRGVTARDVKNERVKLPYTSILRFQKRHAKNIRVR